MAEELRTAIVRTSDRSLFRRCRRKWGWNSGLRQNLTVKDSPSYFWIGTGGHFALEDFHGYNRFGHPVEAFHAYVAACRVQHRRVKHGLPEDWKEQTELAEGILENYLVWGTNRDTYETYWIDGEPQVEVVCQIELPVPPPPGFDRVVYQITLDRMVIIDGELWILDWKFYKTFSQTPLIFDGQMSAYIWAASSVFEMPIAGAIFTEFRKTLPNAPRILANGKLSTAEKQGTTHGLYRQAIIDIYGDVNKAPTATIRCLNDLAARESEDRDDFIKRQRTRRTEPQQQAEGTKILMELEDMFNPDLPLYPNPTRDCSWDCSLQDVCLMMDRDDDWKGLLEETTVTRVEGGDEWRRNLKWPKAA